MKALIKINVKVDKDNYYKNILNKKEERKLWKSNIRYCTKVEKCKITLLEGLFNDLDNIFNESYINLLRENKRVQKLRANSIKVKFSKLKSKIINKLEEITKHIKKKIISIVDLIVVGNSRVLRI